MIGVVGAGAGGLAVAAQLASAGHPVAVYDVRREAVVPLRQRDLVSRGSVETERPVAVCETLEELARDCDVIFVVIPNCALGRFATEAAPHLRDGQTWVLLPGGAGAGLEVNRAWRQAAADFTLVETDTLPFVSRLDGPGEVVVSTRLACLGYAVLRGPRADAAERLLLELVPAVHRHSNSLEIVFGHVTPIVYAPTYLLGVARFEGSDLEESFFCGVTRSIARCIEALDKERLRVAAAYGCQPQPLLKLLATRFGVEASKLHDAFVRLANTAYQGVPIPRDTKRRFVTEHVASGLVPLVELARLAHTPVPAMETLIAVAELVTGVSYWSIGRTLEKMGFDRMEERQAILG